MIKKVIVIGGGTMGAGIAQVCAQSGYECILYDIQPTMLQKAKDTITKNLQKAEEIGKLEIGAKEAILKNIVFTENFENLQGDLVIEAIIEKKEAKIDLFNKISSQNEKHIILGTNTSSIPITQIAAGATNPEMVVGIHFFNPAHLMKLVEIISGAQTSPSVVQEVSTFVGSLGKTVVLANDAPGFIVNRVARHFYVEGLKILEEKVASIEDIDTLCEASGFKMGPFKLMDLIGVDTNYSVTESMYMLFNQEARFRPNRIQKQKVDAGMHGRKSGKGFYNYEK